MGIAIFAQSRQTPSGATSFGINGFYFYHWVIDVLIESKLYIISDADFFLYVYLYVFWTPTLGCVHRLYVTKTFLRTSCNCILPQFSFKINKRLGCQIWFFQCWYRCNQLISSRATCAHAPRGPTDSWAFNAHARTHECFSRCSEFSCHRSAVSRCSASTATTPATLKQTEDASYIKNGLLSSEGQ